MIYYGQMVSSSLSISVDKQMYSRRNEAFGKIYKFWSCESEQSKNVTSALSQGQVSICQTDNQYIQTIMKTIIDGS